MISKRAEVYGESLFRVTADKSVAKFLEDFCESLEDKQINEFFNSSIISVDDKKQSLLKVLDKKHSEIKNFLFLLLDREAFCLLPEISNYYQKLLNDKMGVVTGTIYSHEEIAPTTKKEIEASIEKFLNKKVDLKQKKDKNLIAAFM